MASKKVLVFESYPFFSGAQRVSLNFCKVLKANNIHVTLLLADNTGQISKKFESAVDEVIVLNTNDNLKVYGNGERWLKASNIISSLFTGLFPFYGECFKILKQHKFDSCYFCDPRGAVMMLVPMMFFKGKKICYLQGKNKLRSSIARLIYFTFNDHVLCPSVDVLESLPKSRKKMVLNYGIDFSQYAHIDPLPVASEIKQFLNNDDQKRIKLLYAGLIKPLKGIHHIIYSLKQLKDNIKEEDMPLLFILGEPKSEAEENFKKYLIEYIDKQGLQKYIFWMGWKDNVLEWMKNADYFIFSTIDKENCNFKGFDTIIESTEGSPVVLIESSLCELFTIASKVTGVNEIITDYHNGLIYDPNDEGALLNTLTKVIHENPHYKDFPTRHLFSPDLFSSKILQILNCSNRNLEEYK